MAVNGSNQPDESALLRSRLVKKARAIGQALVSSTQQVEKKLRTDTGVKHVVTALNRTNRLTQRHLRDYRNAVDSLQSSQASLNQVRPAELPVGSDNDLRPDEQPLNMGAVEDYDLQDPVEKARAINAANNPQGAVDQSSPMDQPEDKPITSPLERAKNAAEGKSNTDSRPVSPKLKENLPDSALGALQKAKNLNGGIPGGGMGKSPLGNAGSKLGMGGGMPGGGGMGASMPGAGKGAGGINPQVAGQAAQSFASGDLGGAMKAGMGAAKQMLLEKIWDTCSTYLIPSYTITFLGMEAAVFMGAWWGIKITWWKRWIVHAVNIVIIMILVVQGMIILTVFIGVCKVISNSWFSWLVDILMPVVKVAEYLTGIEGVSMFKETCDNLMKNSH